MDSKKASKRLRSGALAFALLVGCGGSASHSHPDPQPPGPASGAAGDSQSDAGESGTAGSAAAPSAGGSDPGTGGKEPSSGGAAIGGRSPGLGGAAGAAASPPLVLPPGCEPRTPMESADNCSLGVHCDASPSTRTYCYRLDSGQWECQCAYQDNIYRVENAPGIQACALAGWLCSDQTLKLGKESCERTQQSSEKNSCTIDFACSKPVDVKAVGDAQAWLMRFGSVRCDGDDTNGHFGCGCKNGSLASSYDVLANSADVACGPFSDFCISGATPVLDGEKCAPMLSSSESGECQRFEACGPSTPLTKGVDLARLKTRFAECVTSENGGSDCSCSGEDYSFSFRLSTPPTDPSCEASIPNCDPHAVIEATGPASCDTQSLDINDADSCTAVLGCVQNATIDNRSIAVTGGITVYCSRAATGTPWSCECGSNSGSANIDLGATGANATQACTQASTSCTERLGVHLGPVTGI